MKAQSYPLIFLRYLTCKHARGEKSTFTFRNIMIKIKRKVICSYISTHTSQFPIFSYFVKLHFKHRREICSAQLLEFFQPLYQQWECFFFLLNNEIKCCDFIYWCILGSPGILQMCSSTSFDGKGDVLDWNPQQHAKLLSNCLFHKDALRKKKFSLHWSIFKLIFSKSGFFPCNNLILFYLARRQAGRIRIHNLFPTFYWVGRIKF